MDDSKLIEEKQVEILEKLNKLYSNETVINTGNFYRDGRYVSTWFGWKLNDDSIAALVNYPEQEMSLLSVEKNISDVEEKKIVELVSGIRGYKPNTSSGDLYTNHFWHKHKSVGSQINYFFRSVDAARKSLFESQTTSN